MTRFVAVCLLALAAVGGAAVSPDLGARLAVAGPGEYLSVNVVLKEQFDPRLLNSLVAGMPRAARRVEVARILREFSELKQVGLLAELNASGARDITPLWVVNAVHCEATAELIQLVAGRPEVDYVGYDLAYAPDVLEEPGETAPPTAEIPWGVQRINAPAVWALGHTGQGIVVGVIDTGCDYAHPDFADHLWSDANYPHHGWDFENNDDDPMDEMGHGTNTAGCVLSDGTGGSQCGVAPDAQLMACRVRAMADSIAESECWQAMQFCVSPPLSPANGADVYVNTLGWVLSWNPQQATWRSVIDDINAAGLVQVNSAGGERGTAPPNAVRCPGNVPPPWWNPQNTGVGALSGSIACGATDSLESVASFSSPGPVTWATVAPYNDYVYPPGLTKPEVSAPGVNIRTTQRNGGYTVMSGTSWATAYTAGAAALLLGADTMLSPAAVDSMLEVSAVDLGPSGKDNDYGAGRIDVLAAMTGISDKCRTPSVERRALATRPNPFKGTCFIGTDEPVEVVDAAGRRVATASGGLWRPAAGVEPGVYFIRERSAVSGERHMVRVTHVR